MGSLARPSGLGACAEVLEFGTGEHRAVVTLNRRHFVGCIRTGPSASASSMTTITQAKKPTVIQHGEFDTRVPTPNAYELYQGLQDVGVPVRLIIYKGFGHGLNRPKAARAAMEHNLEWFDRYVFGDLIRADAGAAR